MFEYFKRRSQNYKTIFNSSEGEQLLQDLAKFCNAYTPTHSAGDPLQTAFNEGKREVYNYIVRTLETNDELLHRMYYQGVDREHLRAHLEQQETHTYE